MRAGAMSAGWGERRMVLLEQFIAGFGIVYGSDRLCSLWARLKAEARLAGRGLSPQDARIAATAIELSCPIATNNRRDFAGIAGLSLMNF